MTGQQVIALREILAATDFSTQFHQAFEAGLALAQHFGARFHLVHVLSDGSEQKMAQAKLDALAPEIQGVHVVTTVSIGNAASEIVKYARREKIDLIVLGTHGRSGLARMFMGSVAEEVTRTAPCQVLTIGPKVEATAPVQVLPAAPVAPESHCLVCAKPSPTTICDSCKAHIQGEALERKRRDEQPGHRF